MGDRNKHFSFSDFLKYTADKGFDKFVHNKLKDLFIGFVIVNSYDIDTNPMFFLVIHKLNSKSIHHSYFEETLDLDPKEAYTPIYILPIAKRNVDFNVDTYDVSTKHCCQFRTTLKKELIKFIYFYYKSFNTPVPNEFVLKSIIFDVFNIKLKPSSIRINEDLQNKIRDFNNSLENFISLYNQPSNYSLVFDFIIESRPLNKENKYWSHVDKTLAVNEKYSDCIKQLKEIFFDKNIDNSRERKNYEDESVRTLQNALKIIGYL